MAGNDAHEKGRLRARPIGPADFGPAPAGLLALGPGGARDGYLYAPAPAGAASVSPLVLLLHGAGEDARDGLAQLREQADAFGLVLLALSSRAPTWDLIVGRGRCGPDVARIDAALERAFSQCEVDPARVAVAGYSDGASYALALGLANGDLFTHVMAFSPGFLASLGQTGSPRIFVSHGTCDGWLPIDSCSRRIVPQLERAGYDVTYREFDGPHVVPPGIGREAARWLVAGRERDA